MKDACKENLRGYLYRRGMKRYKELDRKDLMLPRDPDQIDEYYRLMKRYSFRLVIRDIIKRRDGFRDQALTHFVSLNIVRSYIEKLCEWRIIERLCNDEYRLTSSSIRSFGLTLEWFTSEVLRREFGAETVWGVRFHGTKHGGDYDVIALMEGTLCYVEVKSSPPKHIEQREVEAFFNRMDDLLPQMALFMVDTELRMKDKLLPMFAEELERRYRTKTKEKHPVERMERELFRVDHHLYLINTKKDIETNLRACLIDHLKFKYFS